jgi:hypothetical protein
MAGTARGGDEDVRCFELTIFLSTDNPAVGPTFNIVAGNNQTEVANRRFQTRQTTTPRGVYSQLLRRLAEAVDAGQKTIPLRVDELGLILQDTFPALASDTGGRKAAARARAADAGKAHPGGAKGKKSTRSGAKTSKRKASTPKPPTTNAPKPKAKRKRQPDG